MAGGVTRWLKHPALRAIVLGGAGLGLLVVLVDRSDASAVLESLRTAGPAAIGFVLLHALSLAIDGVAWGVLVERSVRPGLGRLLHFRWVCEGVNNLLPVARVGGDLSRAVLMANAGVGTAQATASVVIDMVVGVLTEALVALIAVALLALSGRSEVSGAMVGGLGLTVISVGAVIVAGRRGWLGAGAARLAHAAASSRLRGIAGDATRFGEAIDRLSRRTAALWACGLLRVVSALAGALEVWVGLAILGAPVSAADAFVLYALTTAARSAAFLVPGGLGVQEAAFVVLGGPLGIPASAALALALLVRMRELVLGAPGLVLGLVSLRTVGGATGPSSTDAR